MNKESYYSDSYYSDEYSSDNQETQEDNTTVQEKLTQFGNYIDNENFNEAESLLEKIRNSTQNDTYSYLILQSFILLKNNEFDKAYDVAKQASDIEKKSILPYKIQIYSQKRKIDKLVDILKNMNQNKVDLDLEIMILISPRLPKIAKCNDSVTNFYFNSIKDESLIPAIQYIPPSKNTLEQRIKVLKNYQKNTNACSMLIQILIKEKGLIDKASDFLQYLPKEHPTRLLYKILFGSNPVKNAKILCSQEGNDQHFQNFVKFYEEKNYISLRRFIQNEPFFAAGWRLLADLSKDDISKYIALKKSNDIHETSEVKRKLDELTGTLLVLDNKGEDFILYSSLEDEKQYKEAQEIWNRYKKSKDKEDLKPFLDMKNSFLIVPIKAEAIIELSDVIGKEEVIKQLELMKETKYKKIYNIIGHFMLKNGNVEEATENFLKDASFGSDDPVCLEIASKKLIQDGNIEEALNICKKVHDHEWAIFRAGLIYQRLGNHSEAVNMFYKIIRNRQSINVNNDNNNNNNDNNNNSNDDDNLVKIGAEISNFVSLDRSISVASVWKAVAQSYAAMNRYMALKDVLAELRKIGCSYPDYESLYSVFHEENISIDHEYDINSSPICFLNFMRQIIANIQMLKWQGRIDACQMIVSKYKEIILQFNERWGNLGAILKSSGDFFLEGFIVSGNQDQELFNHALNSYKKRANIDLVPESFVDIAKALHVSGKDEEASKFLKRVLLKFPDSQIIWINLGVLYALISKLSLARHCFIIASRISFDSQNGKVYTFIAMIEKALDDLDMMEKSIRMAEEMNLMDVSLLQFKSSIGKIGQYDASLCIYEGEIVSPNLPSLCIKKGRFVEALGYALMMNDNDEIAAAYEALGKYEQALQFSQNEEQRNRLSELIGPSINNNSSNDEIDSVINKFKEGNDFVSKMTVAALYITKNDKNEAFAILKSLLANANNKTNNNNDETNAKDLNIKDIKIPKKYMKLLLTWLLQIAPSEEEINHPMIDSDPLLFFLNLKRSEEEGASVLQMYKKFINNPYAIKMFVLLFLKNNYQTINLANFVSAAESLVLLSPSRESIKILIASQIRAQHYEEAKKLIQKLQILDPNEIPRTIELLKKLNK